MPDWYDGNARQVTLSLSGFEGWTATVELDENITFLLRNHERIRTGEMAERYEEARIAKTAQIVQRLKETYGNDPMRMIRTTLNALKDESDNYCKRWDELMERLRTVEQLYIAV